LDFHLRLYARTLVASRVKNIFARCILKTQRLPTDKARTILTLGGIEIVVLCCKITKPKGLVTFLLQLFCAVCPKREPQRKVLPLHCGSKMFMR